MWYGNNWFGGETVATRRGGAVYHKKPFPPEIIEVEKIVEKQVPVYIAVPDSTLSRDIGITQPDILEDDEEVLTLLL